MAVNVFGFEDNDVLPVRITKCRERSYQVNLLLLQSENQSHYVVIKNIHRFLSDRRKGNSSYYFCQYCLHGFTSQNLLNDHIQYCQVHDAQKIELPTNKDCFLEFKAYEKTLRVPYVIYADCECLNKTIRHL